jgi:hypothetical protein
MGAAILERSGPVVAMAAGQGVLFRPVAGLAGAFPVLGQFNARLREHDLAPGLDAQRVPEFEQQ